MIEADWPHHRLDGAANAAGDRHLNLAFAGLRLRKAGKRPEQDGGAEDDRARALEEDGRALQQAEQLTVTTRRGIAKERELLLAQLDEHNYHLRYNLKMRDIVTDSLAQWAIQNDSGE